MTSWREHLKVHRACDLFPAIPQDELKKLGDSIKNHNLKEKIKIRRLKDGAWELIDGRNRLDAMEMVGMEPFKADGKRVQQFFEIVTLADNEVVDYVTAANLLRRHMTVKQRTALGISLLKLEPTMSDHEVAKKVKVDHKTIAKARKGAEARGEIPHTKTRTDSKGRKQQAQKPAKLKKTKTSPIKPYDGLKKKLTGQHFDGDPVLIIGEASNEELEALRLDNDIPDWIRKLAEERLFPELSLPVVNVVETGPGIPLPKAKVEEPAPDDAAAEATAPGEDTLQARVDRLADEIHSEAEALPVDDRLFFLDSLRSEIDIIERVLKKPSPSVVSQESEAAE